MRQRPVKTNQTTTEKLISYLDKKDFRERMWAFDRAKREKVKTVYMDFAELELMAAAKKSDPVWKFSGTNNDYWVKRELPTQEEQL